MSMNEGWLLIVGGLVVALVAWRMFIARRTARGPSVPVEAAETAADQVAGSEAERLAAEEADRKSTRLNSSH
mgnify:CR=1 FL=1